VTVSSDVDGSPKGEADEMLTVDIRIVLHEVIGNANDEMLRRLQYPKLETLLALLRDRVPAIHTREFVGALNNFLPILLVVD
jgi:hypothetical protein